MMKRITWIGIGVVITVALISFIAWKFSSGTPVRVTEVKRGLIQEFIDERGMTRLPETYLITMPYAGRVESISLTEGERVNRNDPDKPVARIVPKDLQLSVDEAQAVVDRLDAAIIENMDENLEKLLKEQSLKFVLSMGKTVEAANERLRAGQAKLDYSESNQGRVTQLSESQVATQDDVDRAKLEYITAEVDFAQDRLVLAIAESLDAATKVFPRMVDQTMKDKSLTAAVLSNERAEAAARLMQAQLNQKRGTLTSPVDGIVLARYVSNERSLAAGEPLLEIGRPDEELQVEVDVLSLDVVRIKKDTKVKIYGPAVGASRQKGIDGKVLQVYPAGFTKVSSLGVEQQRVKVIIGFKDQETLTRLRKEHNLGVGYRVRVQVFTNQAPNALLIPRSALFRGSDGQWQVYCTRGGRAEIQEVQIGLMNDELAQVTGGLAEQDLVVLAPESNLEDGMKVEAEGVSSRLSRP